MLHEEIDGMIMTARKERSPEKVLVYQAVKNEFLKFRTAKNAGTLDEAAEMGIVRKMIKTRKESAEIFKTAGREDLERKERMEIEILQTLLPKEPEESDYGKVLEDFITTLGDKPFDKTQMGNAIKYLKANLPGADGGIASGVVRKRLEQ